MFTSQVYTNEMKVIYLINFLSERAAFSQSTFTTCWGAKNLSATGAHDNGLWRNERREKTNEKHKRRLHEHVKR
jgi:hypothetical protein